MHICIIGTGAAGWLACNLLKRNKTKNIEKITIIGSPEIPSIGVGESNTLTLNNIHASMNIDLNEFVHESDAALKYGVLYDGWSKNKFLHFFKGDQLWNELAINYGDYGKTLANKPTDVNISDIYGEYLTSCALQNRICRNQLYYPYSWHFDAGLYIKFLSKLALKDKKVSLIHDTVIDCEFEEDEKIKKIFLKERGAIEADYYIIATGSTQLNEKVLKQEYHDLSDILLTNKALFLPLKYTDKKKQFHPYTASKTMKHGWRWITPTYSRVGTGYVFSSNHVSEDEAISELLNDIGDTSLSPNIVNFGAKYNKKTFKENYCTIGMANGFLEPLDAPGLTLSMLVLGRLETLLYQKSIMNDEHIFRSSREIANDFIDKHYKFWSAFILCQYKTCMRNDTDFWADHKNVKYDYYDFVMESLDFSEDPNYGMLYHTIAGKDVQWKTPYDSLPFKVPDAIVETMDHLEFIEQVRKRYKEKTDPSSQNIWK